MSKKSYILIFTFLYVSLIQNYGLAQNVHPPYNGLFDISDIGTTETDPLIVYQNLNRFNESQNNRIKKSLTDYTHRLDSLITWEFDFNTPFRVRKEQLLYDSISSVEKQLFWTRNHTTNLWVGTDYLSWQYNENDMLIHLSYNLWDGDYNNLDEKTPQLLQKFYYDEEGFRTKATGQNAAAILGGYNSYEVLNYYNRKNLLEKKELYFWDQGSNSLVLREETIYKHNDQKQLIEIVRWHLHTTRGWEYDDSTRLERNSKGQLVRELGYNWDPSEDSFYPTDEYIYIYNPDGTKNRNLLFWNLRESNNTWKQNRFEYYNYHDYGSLSTIAEYDSSFMYYPPEKYYETKYTHDEHISLDQVWLPRSSSQQYHYFQNHLLLSRQEFDVLNFNYPEIKYEYHYSPLITSTTEEAIQEDHVMTIYPNPASSGHICISIPDNTTDLDVTIYNINGQALINRRIHNNDQLSIEALDSGIYFVRVAVKGKVYTGRIVKI